MGVSKNKGTTKSSILIGFSITNHPFWGPTPIFGNTHMSIFFLHESSTPQLPATYVFFKVNVASTSTTVMVTLTVTMTAWVHAWYR